MKKILIRIISAIVILFVVCLGVILYQNNYNMKVTAVKIPTSKGVLNGSLVLPKNSQGKVGLVVFIHGDGPANASYNGGYEPLWEKLANQGYASLSWSKPGVNGSSGNWLEQTMDERAIEATEVINWAKSLQNIDKERVGLWGASQAGWVIPKIVRKDKNVAFTILVAPAINWIDQGLYNTLAQMKKDSRSIKQQEQAKETYEWSLSMLKKNVTYQQYHDSQQADKNMTEERWKFIQKNFKSDAAEDIKHFYSPVKLSLGGRDVNVDSANTKMVYEKNVPKNLLNVTVIPSADHSMLRASLVDSKFLTTLYAIFAPRQLTDKNYYEGIHDFLQSVDNPK